MNKIKITYNNEREIIKDSCLFSDYENFCSHPNIEKRKLICKYGLTEINVPENCPLRKKSLITKIELLTN
ncbi:MAG: hypothetical protein PVJ67_05590 [Candidatus Pacearchaeota archaeon]|jgi:hypothetical protein